MIYHDIISQNKSWIDDIMQKLDKKLSHLAVKSFDKLPFTTENGVHVPYNAKDGINITWWTNGFWGGLMWLMYANDKKACYKATALHSEELLDGAWEYPDRLDHDVGFLWHILSGASHTLTGDERSFARNLKAADLLVNRYNEKGDYIVAWNDDDPVLNVPGWTIIDTMMNLPLLYWATKQTGNPKYAEVAKRHADMALRDHVRPDGSVAHIVSHKTDCPEVITTYGGQGYGVGSSWSRGLGWAIYGFVLSYIHTGEIRYLEASKSVAHYFIANVALTDWLPLIDFRAPESPVKYDSSASAVVACGLIELAKIVPEYEKALYLNSAIKILKAIEQKFCDWSFDEDGVLLGCSGHYGKEEDINLIYGDYFFAEAILKLTGNEFLPW